MQNEGLKIINNSDLKELKSAGSAINLTTKDDRDLGEFDQVIYAIGRSPLTAELNLQSAGVDTDSRGYIPTDEFQATNVESIFALGDATGRAQLTPCLLYTSPSPRDRG